MVDDQAPNANGDAPERQSPQQKYLTSAVLFISIVPIFFWLVCLVFTMWSGNFDNKIWEIFANLADGSTSDTTIYQFIGLLIFISSSIFATRFGKTNFVYLIFILIVASIFLSLYIYVNAADIAPNIIHNVPTSVDLCRNEVTATCQIEQTANLAAWLMAKTVAFFVIVLLAVLSLRTDVVKYFTDGLVDAIKGFMR